MIRWKERFAPWAIGRSSWDSRRGRRIWPISSTRISLTDLRRHQLIDRTIRRGEPCVRPMPVMQAIPGEHEVRPYRKLNEATRFIPTARDNLPERSEGGDGCQQPRQAG